MFNFLMSCNNKSDEILPAVKFILPYENEQFNVLDTIPIKAEISDNNQLVSIEVSLTDENFIPILRVFSIPIKTNPMQLAFEYPLTDYFMESGKYNLLLKVDDGFQLKHKYQTVYISAIERQFIGLAISRQTSSGYAIDQFDSALSNQTNLVNSDSFQQIAVIPYQNIMGIAQSEKNMIAGWNYRKKENIWSKINEHPLGISRGEKSFYTFHNNGLIKEFGLTGALKRTIIDSDFLAERLIPMNSYLVTCSKYIHYPQYQSIRVYNSSTGQVFQTYSLDFNLLTFFAISPNEIILFGNLNGTGQVRIYNLATNTITKLRDLNGEILKEAAFILENEFILTLGGDLRKLKLSDLSLTSYLTGTSFQKIVYEPLNDWLICAETDKITVFNYATQAPIKTINYTTGTIFHEIKPLYNR